MTGKKPKDNIFDKDGGWFWVNYERPCGVCNGHGYVKSRIHGGSTQCVNCKGKGYIAHKAPLVEALRILGIEIPDHNQKEPEAAQ